MNLDNLSKKLRIDIRYFLPNGILLASRFFATTFITLLISVAFARLTDKEIFGQYQYVLSVVALLSVFSFPGLNTAALRAFVEGDEHAIERSVRYSFLSSLLASIILIVIGIVKYIQGSTLLGWSFGIAALLIPFFYAPNNWYLYYEGKLNFRASTIRLVGLNLVVLAAMVIALKSNITIVGLVALYFGLNALLTSGLYLEGKRTVSSSKEKTKLSLNYAWRCTVQKFTTTLAENVQAIVLSAVFGFANLAIYQVAQSFVNAFVGLMGALGSTYFPLLFKYKRLNHGLIVVQHIVLGLGFFLIYWVALTFIFAPLYGAKYADSILLGHKLGFIVIIIPLRIYLCNFFSSQDRNGVVTVTNLFASAVALLLFFSVKSAGFFPAAVVYLYTLNGLMVLPLLIIYGYYLKGTIYSSMPDGPKNLST